MQNIQKIANSTARKYGYGSATEIVFGYVSEPDVIEHIRYGYRKRTTGQYVPKAYMAKFGWKNCYYQAAQTKVVLPYSVINWEE